jgi:hypothetical protein
MKVSLRFSLILVLVPIVLPGPSAGQEAKAPETLLWSETVLSLGRATLTGDLHLRLELGRVELGGEALVLALEPFQSITAEGDAETRFRVAQLETIFVPDSLGHRWHPPGRTVRRLELLIIGEMHETAWGRVRRDRSGSFQVTDEFGTTLLYEEGQLTRVDLNDRHYLVTAQGGKIHRIEDPAIGRVLVGANWSATGRLERVWTQAWEATLRYRSSDSSQLDAVSNRGESINFVYSFSYDERNLLRSVQRDDELVDSFSWGRTGDFRHPASLHAQPYQLTGDLSHTYQFAITKNGYELRRFPRGEGLHEELIYNPTRETIRRRTWP